MSEIQTPGAGPAEATDKVDATGTAAPPAFDDKNPLLNVIKPNTLNADGTLKTPAELLHLHHDIKAYVDDRSVKHTDPQRHARHVAEVAYLEHLIGKQSGE